MLHFLLQKNRKEIISEYLLRVSIFALIFISVISCVLIALFLPSFFFVEYKSATIHNQAQSINLSNINTYESSASTIKNINGMVQALSYTIPRTQTTDLIDTIVSLKNKNITISSISIAPDASDSTVLISISGVSVSRDDLTSFYTNLKGEEGFQNVVLPVTSLISDTNAPFTITFTYTGHSNL